MAEPQLGPGRGLGGNAFSGNSPIVRGRTTGVRGGTRDRRGWSLLQNVPSQTITAQNTTTTALDGDPQGILALPDAPELFASSKELTSSPVEQRRFAATGDTVYSIPLSEVGPDLRRELRSAVGRFLEKDPLAWKPPQLTRGGNLGDILFFNRNAADQIDAIGISRFARRLVKKFRLPALDGFVMYLEGDGKSNGPHNVAKVMQSAVEEMGHKNGYRLSSLAAGQDGATSEFKESSWALASEKLRRAKEKLPMGGTAITDTLQLNYYEALVDDLIHTWLTATKRSSNPDPHWANRYREAYLEFNAHLNRLKGIDDVLDADPIEN